MQIISIILFCVFIDTITKEYQEDGRVYIATIVGTVLAGLNIIIMIANFSVPSFYESFHLTAVCSMISHQQIITACAVVILIDVVYLLYTMIVLFSSSLFSHYLWLSILSGVNVVFIVDCCCRMLHRCWLQQPLRVSMICLSRFLVLVIVFLFIMIHSTWCRSEIT